MATALLTSGSSYSSRLSARQQGGKQGRAQGWAQRSVGGTQQKSSQAMFPCQHAGKDRRARHASKKAKRGGQGQRARAPALLYVAMRASRLSGSKPWKASFTYLQAAQAQEHALAALPQARARRGRSGCRRQLADCSGRRRQLANRLPTAGSRVAHLWRSILSMLPRFLSITRPRHMYRQSNSRSYSRYGAQRRREGTGRGGFEAAARHLLRCKGPAWKPSERGQSGRPLHSRAWPSVRRSAHLWVPKEAHELVHRLLVRQRLESVGLVLSGRAPGRAWGQGWGGGAARPGARGGTRGACNARTQRWRRPHCRMLMQTGPTWARV